MQRMPRGIFGFLVVDGNSDASCTSRPVQVPKVDWRLFEMSRWTISSLRDKPGPGTSSFAKWPRSMLAYFGIGAPSSTRFAFRLSSAPPSPLGIRKQCLRSRFGKSVSAKAVWRMQISARTDVACALVLTPNVPATSLRPNPGTFCRTARVELLAWINDLLGSGYTKIEQCGSGAVYCQVSGIKRLGEGV